MKRFKKIAWIAFLLILIPVVLLFINNQKSKRLDKYYADPSQAVHSQHYILEELKLPGKHLVLQSVDRPTSPLEESGGMSFLRYDPLKQQIIISSEENVQGEEDTPGSDKIIHLSYFSMDGKLVGHKSGLYGVDDAGLENTVLLKDYILPFQKWKDEKQEIFLKHFGILHFDLSSLNPIWFPSPNGGSPRYTWSGTGYYDLKIGNDTLKLKFPVRKEELFFTEKHSYDTNLSYYKLPSLLKLEAPTFLVYLPFDTNYKIFIIRKIQS